jgi:hypothetical protein
VRRPPPSPLTPPPASPCPYVPRPLTSQGTGVHRLPIFT